MTNPPVVIVSGASRGLGKAVALWLAAAAPSPAICAHVRQPFPDNG